METRLQGAAGLIQRLEIVRSRLASKPGCWKTLVSKERRNLVQVYLLLSQADLPFHLLWASLLPTHRHVSRQPKERQNNILNWPGSLETSPISLPPPPTHTLLLLLFLPPNLDLPTSPEKLPSSFFSNLQRRRCKTLPLSDSLKLYDPIYFLFTKKKSLHFSTTTTTATTTQPLSICFQFALRIYFTRTDFVRLFLEEKGLNVAVGGKKKNQRQEERRRAVGTWKGMPALSLQEQSLFPSIHRFL